MKTQLVSNNGKSVFTTSLIIAEGCGVEHRAILALIKTHTDKLENFNTHFKCCIKKGKTQKIRYYDLGESESTFLIALMRNSEVVVNFKFTLVKEFYNQRETIRRLIHSQTNPDYMQVRRDGINVYHQKTDVIKDFIEYATEQGSKSPKLYYMNLAKMENKALFVIEQKYPNVRDVLDVMQLMQICTADQIVNKALKEGMDKKLEYKKIYLLAKDRVLAFAEILGQSPILGLTRK